MTRGTISCVVFNPETGQFEINSSTEFNGDMAPDMSSGKTTLKRLKTVKNIEEFKDVVWDTVIDYEYTDMFESREDKLLWNHLCETKGDNIDNPFDIDDVVLSKVFNYSDYEYLINLSDKSFFFTDRNDNTIELYPNSREIAIFDYCHYIGSMLDGKLKLIPKRER